MRNKEVCKAFVEDKKAKTGHLFTEIIGTNCIIYSYGHHFPLGVKLSDGRVFINSDKYSQTTSRHRGELAYCLGFNGFEDLKKNGHERKISLKNTEELREISLNIRRGNN